MSPSLCPAPRPPGRELVRISVLARRSGVPAPTIKHYLREGLLEPAVKTSRNSALYDAALVGRIRAIKDLQRTRFLPLKVIREVLAGHDGPADSPAVGAAISRVLAGDAPVAARSREDLLAAGYPAVELDWLRAAGLVTSTGGPGGEVYAGDDLSLIETLLAARQAGLRPDMLPLEILDAYRGALAALVEVELQIFRAGVLPRAGGDVERLAAAATALSERLVVLLRRKLLVPTLEAMARTAPSRGRAPAVPRTTPTPRARSTRKGSRRRTP